MAGGLLYWPVKMSVGLIYRIRAVAGRWRFLLLAIAWIACPAPPGDAQSASVDEVKAAFLFTFSKFVEWPAGVVATHPEFTIGVIDQEDIARALDNLGPRKSMDGRPLAVKRLSMKERALGVDILFIGKNDQASVAAILQGIQGTGVLTVSDFERFCQLGGAIQFQLDHDRMRFDINITATDHAGLSINSKLLSLARTIVGARESGGLK
jgi:hypothetical protein